MLKNLSRRSTRVVLPMLLTLLLGTALAFAQSGGSSDYRVLYAFTGGEDGGQPMSGLIRDRGGNLFGTTEIGGKFNLGVVFKLNPSGVETVLHHFTGGADGAYPLASLVRDVAGNLYGTANEGGTSCIFSSNGCGVVFKISAAGKFSVLYSFTGNEDGSFPDAPLLIDSEGNLFGTAPQGGMAGGCGGAGCGVVFKIDQAGHETVLYTFTGLADGGEPTGKLIRDAQGNFYGTASLGGRGNCGIGCGVVFKLDPAGNEKVIYTFNGIYDGGVPVSGLVADRQGSLFGTTEYRGNSDWGVVFKLNHGAEAVIHEFTGGADGATPRGDLALDPNGNIYGTAVQGGSACSPFTCGVIFRITKNGKGGVLHDFSGNDGLNPYAGLLLDHGVLYGTTSFGGANGVGVVFQLKP